MYIVQLTDHFPAASPSGDSDAGGRVSFNERLIVGACVSTDYSNNSPSNNR